MKNPIVFLTQVRQELARVVWPTRQELTVATIQVFILVMIAATFFLVADWVIVRIIRLVLGI